MSERAVSPAIGVVAILGLTVVLAASVAVLVGGLALPSEPPDARFVGEFDPDQREITIRHDGGDPVARETLALRVDVDGEPLAAQPPIPFFAASGFDSGPTGPFNPSGPDTWAAGTAGRLGIATTNDPVPTANSSVTVTVLVDDHVVAVLELGAG